MTDVKRWVDDGASEPVRTLLAAAREERPDEAGVQRTLVAIGLGSAVATGASHAAGGAGAATLAKSATGASTLALVTKWGAIGALGAVTTFGAVEMTTHAFSPAPANVPVTAPVARPMGVRRVERYEPYIAADQPAPEPAAAEPAAPPITAPAVRAAPSLGQERAALERADNAAESERILEEVRVIDKARSALASGDGRATLAALDSYGKGFSARRFEPEALYLRMEALERLGDAPGAKTAAERLLAAFPNAPQAARARIVAGLR